MGRFGRRSYLSPLTGVNDIQCDLDRYCAVYRQIHYSLSKLQNTKQNVITSKQQSKQDFKYMMRLLVLLLGCFQAKIANHLSHPCGVKHIASRCNDKEGGEDLSVAQSPHVACHVGEVHGAHHAPLLIGDAGWGKGGETVPNLQ